MLYLVFVDRNGMAAQLTRSDCEGSNVVDGTNDDMLWNDSEEDEDVSSESDKDEESTDCEDGYSDTDWKR
jgi:hypothetical protein